jgi:hypothetical protein
MSTVSMTYWCPESSNMSEECMSDGLRFRKIVHAPLNCARAVRSLRKDKNDWSVPSNRALEDLKLSYSSLTPAKYTHVKYLEKTALVCTIEVS